MTDWNAVSAFMASVVAWPVSLQDPGYVNLHYSTPDRKNPSGPLRKGMGWPFRSVDDFVSRAAWMQSVNTFKDAWFCLSLQKETKPNRKNAAKPYAHRLAVNALKVKSLWMDVDVGSKPGEYPDIKSALLAVVEFRERHSLPPFSAIVFSGGGIQVYWISQTAMTVEEWVPYAEGLRALMVQDQLCKDPGVTCDVARILRVPGTDNHKYDPPQPVRLGAQPVVMYDFRPVLALLPTLAPVGGTIQVDKSHNVFADGVDLSKFGKPAFTVDDGTSLQEGIDKHSETLLKTEPIFRQCGFYRDALMTGGKDYDQALWMYSILGATFMENGNAVAHEISKGHKDYSPASTEEMYDRKVADRADRGIGYPSCATIAGAGCQACQTGPLLAKGKSPLNIRPIVTAAVNGLNMALPLQQTQTAKDLTLPIGYDVDAEGYICEVVQQEVKGELQEPSLYRLFLSRLSDPWAQSDPDCLNFTTTVDKGVTFDASLRHDEMVGMGLDKALAKTKVKIFPRNKSRLEHFFMSWLAKLHELNTATKSLPFGWYREGDDIKGFVFGGKNLRDDGTEVPCGVGDPQLRRIFHPTGDIKHWFDAAKLITNQKRPELDAIIALSFSAPLTALVGKNAMTMCAYGESGVSKTAAYSVGVSVWGHAKKGKQVSHSTFNGVMKTLGELGNLPMYWDEIKDPKAQQAVYDFIYNASDGVEKARAKSDTSLQHRGTWQTQMMMAANISFVDYVMKKDPSHIAGISRVFEYNIRKAVNPQGRISQTEADVAFDKLQTSYGQMGFRYSKLLGVNHVAIKQECIDTCMQVEKDMQSQDAERLWVALVGTLLVGARLANTLGAELDLEALKVFLYATYQKNREKRDNLMAVSGQRDTTEAIMSAYFSRVDAADQALWTRGMPLGLTGKPQPVEILHGPRDPKNVAVMEQLAIRWDVEGKACYILKDHLFNYLNEAGVGAGTTLDSLKTEYGMRIQRRVRLGAGAFVSGRQTVCVIPNIGPDHDLAELLYKWSPANERPTSPDPPPPRQQVETGLTPVADVVAFVQGATRG